MIKTIEAEVSPEEASKYLDNHNERISSGRFRQRSVSPNIVEKYAADMRAGNWTLCPSPIVFDVEGNLLDGQHRLEAVKKSGKTVPMLVSTGWPKEATNGSLKLGTIDTIDRGRPRSTANQLQIHGVSMATFVASTVNAVVRCCYGGHNMPISYATTCTLLKSYGLQSHIEALTNLGSVSLARGRLFGPLVFYRLTKPRKADEFARQFLNLDFDKNSGPWLLGRYWQDPQNMDKGQMNFIRATCACLRIWDAGETKAYMRPGPESAEWLAETNPKFTEAVRAMVGKREH